MNPDFRIEKIDFVLHPLDMVSVAVEPLGERVCSLAEHGQAIADALDELLTPIREVDRRAANSRLKQTVIQLTHFSTCAMQRAHHVAYYPAFMVPDPIICY
jgi:hypothetical protein